MDYIECEIIDINDGVEIYGIDDPKEKFISLNSENGSDYSVKIVSRGRIVKEYSALSKEKSIIIGALEAIKLCRNFTENQEMLDIEEKFEDDELTMENACKLAEKLLKSLGYTGEKFGIVASDESLYTVKYEERILSDDLEKIYAYAVICNYWQDIIFLQEWFEKNKAVTDGIVSYEDAKKIFL